MHKTRYQFAFLVAAAALSACSDSNHQQQTYDAQGRPLPQQQQSSGDNGLLWGLGGFLLGRMSAPSQAPASQQQIVHQPVYQQQQTPQQNFAKPAPTPAPSPVIGSAVQKPVTPAPVPTPQPVQTKPSYSGPTGYSSVNQAAPTYKMQAVTPTPAPKVAPPPPPPPKPAPAPKPSVSYSFKPSTSTPSRR